MYVIGVSDTCWKWPGRICINVCPIRDKLPVIREGLRTVRICPAFQNSLIVARALIQLGVSGVIVDWAAQLGLDPRLPDSAGRSSIRASRTIRDRRIWTTQADVSRIASPLALTAPQPLIRHVTYVAGVDGMSKDVRISFSIVR